MKATKCGYGFSDTWYLERARFDVDQKHFSTFEEAKQRLGLARAFGYTGVVLGVQLDMGLAGNPKWKNRCWEYINLAKRLKIEVIPKMFGIGYAGSGLLRGHPELKEHEEPIKGAPDWQEVACMSNPLLYEIMEEQFAANHAIFNASTYFLSMDEIRAGGQCPLCKKRLENGETMGEILGACITQQVAIIRSEIIQTDSPDVDICLWSDMIDKWIGARRKQFYLVEYPGFDRSWDYVPRDIIPVVWGTDVDRSVQFFKSEGFTKGCVVSAPQKKEANGLRTARAFKMSKEPTVHTFLRATWVPPYWGNLPALGMLAQTYDCPYQVGGG